MQNVKATIEYEGAKYRGFCLQPNLPTVQGKIEGALATIFEKKIRLIGAGRTDAGVHALGQVINFNVSGWNNLENLKKAINANLPSDIRIRQIEAVGDDFHSRYSAKSREYVYTLAVGEDIPFTLSRFVYRVKGKSVDVGQMRKAAGYLIGQHDFSSFCIVEDPNKNHVREVYDFEVLSDVADRYIGSITRGRSVDLIHFRIRANGFLYKMVRTVVGTLLEVGRGKRRAEEIKMILAAKDRRCAGITLPAFGLCLIKVGYGEEDN